MTSPHVWRSDIPYANRPRRLAERLAALRSPEGAVKPQDYRQALRLMIAHCIFGVDRNPMALELCRTALWLEGFEEGRPLSFLDHHRQHADVSPEGQVELSSLPRCDRRSSNLTKPDRTR